MPKIAYKSFRFSPEAIDAIAKANSVIDAYAKQGFGLTVRQLYYQFFSNGWFSDDRRYSRQEGTGKFVKDPNGTTNAEPNYNWLGQLISKGRMAGLIDWYAITDRTRASKANQHWTRPSQIVEGAMNTYAIDKWANQSHYVEVWVEKEALEEIVGAACLPLDVRYFACRGYTSDSAMWEASQRVLDRRKEGKQVHIIHLGDHDPSGIDMSRDIEEKLVLFTGDEVHLTRAALNMDQIRKYNLAPDPAKQSDSRFAAYEALYGDESWELDALNPSALVSLIQSHIVKYRDDAAWKQSEVMEEKGRGTLKRIIQYFPEVVLFLRDKVKQDESRVSCATCGATENNSECRCDTARNGKLLL